MSLFRKAEGTKSGLKVLAYGATGTGKTTFALSFPEVTAIDSEDGMAWYQDNPNLKNILNTTSAQDVEDALDEIEEELVPEGLIKTFVLDSETKIYENMQLSGLNIAERRARQKGQNSDDANISMREWGKIKLVTKRMQAAKIMMASKGINIISVAQEKPIKEKKGENWITVGYQPDTSKGFEYDYDIVIRLYTEKDPETGEELYKGIIQKDRTATYKKGSVVDNPSFENWKRAYTDSSKRKETVKDYSRDVEKDEDSMGSELEKIEDMVSEFKAVMKKLDKDGQKSASKKVKELGIANPLKPEDPGKMEELLEFVKVL